MDTYSRRNSLAACAIALVLSAVMAPTARSSLLPKDVTARWGPADPSYDFSSVGGIQGAWPLSRHLQLWSSASYYGQRVQWDQFVYVSGYTPPHFSYQTDFIPLGIGVRFYGAGLDGIPRGPFIEAGPVLTVARYQSKSLQRHLAAMGAIQAGFGVRFGSFGPTHGELGVSYSLAESMRSHSDAIGRVGARDTDVSMTTIYAAMGIGR